MAKKQGLQMAQNDERAKKSPKLAAVEMAALDRLY